MAKLQPPLRRKIDALLQDLGVDPALIDARGLPLHEDAIELVVAEVGDDGKEHQLVPDAAAQWTCLKEAADREGVAIFVASAFRSFDRQVEVVRSSIAAGRSVAAVFQHIAPPGCSEHHTGRALDLGTPGCADLSDSFAQTDAFDWLEQNAGRFGFRLSFPPDNPWGYTYEPWHWCYTNSEHDADT